MSESLSGVKNSSQTLKELAGSGPFQEKLRFEIEELDSSFSDITKRIQAHNALLSDMVQQTQKLLDDIRQLESWVDDIAEKSLKKDIAVATKEELSQYETDFKVRIRLFIQCFNY